MTGSWTFLLLHTCIVLCVRLPAPTNVSISSFNMEHILTFLPGPKTPSNTSFTVQTLHLRKSKKWRPVAGCLQLRAGQTCDLTGTFKDPFVQYRARVQAFTSTQASNWTTSQQFQPLSDTVIGPPGVSLSGCGSCLHLQVSVPTTRGRQQQQQLQDLYRGLTLHVRRVRDGVQFRLNLAYKEHSEITYLQPGVEYCVSVSVTGLFNSNSIPSKAVCAYTSPPTRSPVYMVLGLLVGLCMLVLLLISTVVYGGQLSLKLVGRRAARSVARDPGLRSRTRWIRCWSSAAD